MSEGGLSLFQKIVLVCCRSGQFLGLMGKEINTMIYLNMESNEPLHPDRIMREV